MAQFTVYANLNKKTKTTYPYLLDVQNDLFEGLKTRVVIPLCPSSAMGNRSITDLSPKFQIRGTSYTLLTPQLAGIAVSDLGPIVDELSQYRFEIIKALDFLITGF